MNLLLVCLVGFLLFISHLLAALSRVICYMPLVVYATWFYVPCDQRQTAVSLFGNIDIIRVVE